MPASGRKFRTLQVSLGTRRNFAPFQSTKFMTQILMKNVFHLDVCKELFFYEGLWVDENEN